MRRRKSFLIWCLCTFEWSDSKPTAVRIYPINMLSQEYKCQTILRNRNPHATNAIPSLNPDTTRSGTCSTTIGGLQRLCEIFPAMRDLGPDVTPRFINEVLCDEPGGDCGVGEVGGKCRNASVFQDFLRYSSSDASFQVYSQEIRVCCECALTSSWVTRK